MNQSRLKSAQNQLFGGSEMKDMEIINDFVDFLKHDGITYKEICQFLVTVSLKDHGFYCSVFAEIQKNGTVKVTASFGTEQKKIDAWQDMPIEAKTPVNDCLREIRIVWINTLPLYPQDYELLNSLPTDEYLKTLIALPIKDIGNPVGALALLSTQKLEIDKDLELLITNLANLSVMRFNTDSIHESLIKLVNDQKTPVDTALLSALTPRQRKIFKLMIEKKTNKEIAAQIGYSTSTIKQETISIYEILGLRGREDSYLFNEKQ